MTKFYTVWVGRNPGVYDDWDDCLEQVKNFPGARYKAFPNSAAATRAYREGVEQDDSADIANLLNGADENRRKRRSDRREDPRAYMDNPEIDLRAWAVDAACSKNPGPVEYRGVDLMTGKEIFRVGPLQGGTNNLGEFLAIVHALALMEKTGEWHPIYSDSVSGMAWVRNRRIKTTLTPNAENQKLFELLKRALGWLNNHSYNTPVMKWDTTRWGEIPADFGRK